MKKSYFWGLLFAVIALIPGQNVFAQVAADQLPTGYCSVTKRMNESCVVSNLDNVHSHSLQGLTATYEGSEVLSLSATSTTFNDLTSSKQFTVGQGGTIEISFTNGAWSKNVWFGFDWDRDGDFEDVVAAYPETGRVGGNQDQGSVTIYVPDDAQAGKSVMRIISDGVDCPASWSEETPMCGTHGTGYIGYAGSLHDVTIIVEEVELEGEIFTISVSSNDDTMGAATAESTSVRDGRPATLTATANEGYKFVNWTVEGTEVSTENPYKPIITAATNFVANFVALPTYAVSVTANNDAYGSVEATSASVLENGTVTLTATANEGYKFENWTVAGSVVSTANPYTATITAETAFVANFKEVVTIATGKEFRIKDISANQYLTAFNHDAHASGAYGGVGTTAYAEDNEDQIFIFEESGENYKLKTKSGYYIYAQAWNVDALSSQSSEFKFPENGTSGYYMQVLNTNKSNAWYYVKNEYVDSARGYYLFGDAAIGAAATWVLEPVAPAVVTFTVTAVPSDGAMGAVSPETSTVEEGQSVELTATAAEGYQFVNWISGTNTLSEENPFTITPTSDTTIVANFELIPVTPTFAVSAVSADATMGSATVSAAEVEEGAEATFTATANAGYKFTNWTAGTEIISTENPYTATISAATELTANFEALVPAIVLTATPDVERQFSFTVETAAKIFIDWGNGELVETETITEAWKEGGVIDPEWADYQATTITGTPVGEGVVKIYGDITYLDCGYTASYASKVTALDVTNAPYLIILEIASNDITTLDLSQNAELYKLVCDGNPITTLDLTANAKLNRLEASDMLSLTSVELNEGVTSATVKLQRNNFTFATLPALVALSDSKYTYVPQNVMTIATEINEGEELDLSAQNNIVGRAAEAQATDYTWYLADGTEFTSYTEENGKFVFDVTADTELYCTMTTAAFPNFSGTNVLKTTNIVVKNVAGETYNVNIATATGQEALGTVEIVGYEGTSVNIEAGTEITIVATPAEGYQFMSWSDAIGSDVSTEASYTFTVNSDVYLEAWFESAPVATTYAVTVQAAPTSDYGTVAIEGAEGTTASIEENASVTVVATPAEGYALDGWYDVTGETLLSNDLSYTFTVTAETTVVAWFEEATPDTPDYELLDRTSWQVSASSQETSGDPGQVENAIDGDNTTFWHTEYSATTYDVPHWLEIDMVGKFDIYAFNYVSRADVTNGNGNATQYKLYVSENPMQGTFDGLTPAAEGTFSYPSGSTEHVVELATPATGRYVAFVIEDATVGDWITTGKVYGNCAEFYLSGKETPKEPVQLPRSGWTVTASSYEEDGEGASGGWPEHTIDDDQATFWHTDYSVTPNPTVPHWLQYNMGSSYEITGFTYVSRTADGANITCNGNVRTYKFYVSDTEISSNIDATTKEPIGLTPAAEGEFTYDGVSKEHHVDLAESVEGQYLYLLVTDSWNSSTTTKFGNCAEFYAYGITDEEITTYTVSVSASPAEGGTATVNGAATAEVVENAKVTLSASAATGYEFVNWTLEGEVVSTSVSLRVDVTADAEYVANFAELVVETEYCTVTGNIIQGRHLASFSISNGTETLDVQGTTSGGAVYVNRSKTAILEVKPGGIVTFPAFGWQGEWMHAYAYIDYDNDKEFNTTANNDGTTGGEVVTYNCLNEKTINGANASSQYANTSSYTNEYGTSKGLPAFKLPDLIEPGDYRMRISVAWNTLSPCGYSNIKPNGGILLDMTIRVLESDTYFVTVSSSNDELGTAYIGEEGTTDARVANDGTQTLELTAVVIDPAYEFANWTLEGEVVSTEAVYTTTAITENRNYVANFQVKTIEPRTVKVASNDKTKGYAVFVSPMPEGTATDVTTSEWVTVQAYTQTTDDFFVNWTINGEEVGTEAEYIYKGEEAATIQANFISKYIVNVNAPENGTVTLSTDDGGVASGSRVEENDILKVSATPNGGYELTAILVNGENILTEVTASSAIYDVTITGATTIEVVFEELIATLTYEVIGYGSVKCCSTDDVTTGVLYENGATLPLNGDLYVFPTPGEGEELISITINGDDYMNDIEEFGNAFETVTGDMYVVATFTNLSGVEDADADAVQVYAANGVIYINGYEGDVKVVNAAGQVVKDVMVNGAEQLNVNAGLYMVVTGNQVTKVVVK